MHKCTFSETQPYTSLICNDSYMIISFQEQCPDSLSWGIAKSYQFRSLLKRSSPRDIPPFLAARLGVRTTPLT